MSHDLDNDEERAKLTELAPVHESAGFLRMSRNGMSHAVIRDVFGMSPVELVRKSRLGVADEQAAVERGQQILDREMVRQL